MCGHRRALPRFPVADDGYVFGTRHNYAGGGSTNMCLKNVAGAQGGVVQGGQNSNDAVVPLKREHANYNSLPSRNNLLRSRNSWIIPCAKCKYAKSCFAEVGVPECPSGYHKMYTGYMFGGHEGHNANNDRFCIDKNPADNDCEGLNLAGPCCTKLFAPAVAASPLAIPSPSQRVAVDSHSLALLDGRLLSLFFTCQTLRARTGAGTCTQP